MKSTLLCFLLFCSTLFAADPLYFQFSSSGSTLASVTNLVTSVQRARQVITYDVTSDKSSSLLSFITATQRLTILRSTWSTTNENATNALILTFDSTNGLSGNVLIQRNENISTAAIITSITNWLNSTQIVVGVSNTFLPGDWLFILRTNTFPIGAVTVFSSGECIYNLRSGMPLLLQLDGTSTCSINQVVIRY
jgi:hypothetical protein